MVAGVTDCRCSRRVLATGQRRAGPRRHLGPAGPGRMNKGVRGLVDTDEYLVASSTSPDHLNRAARQRVARQGNFAEHLREQGVAIRCCRLPPRLGQVPVHTDASAGSVPPAPRTPTPGSAHKGTHPPPGYLTQRTTWRRTPSARGRAQEAKRMSSATAMHATDNVPGTPSQRDGRVLPRATPVA